MIPQPVPSIEAWRGIAQTPEIVQYCRGLFDRMSFIVAETGEGFTATHHGDALTFSDGVDPTADFTVPLHVENIQRLIAHARDGRIDAGESWRIAAVLFTPLTQATLRNPVMASRWVRRLAGVEDLIHVYLVDPAGQQQATHTLLYAARQWVVLPGLHGVAARIYRLTPDQSLDYQRHVFAARKRNTLVAWWAFARWYRRWRAAVSAAA